MKKTALLVITAIIIQLFAVLPFSVSAESAPVVKMEVVKGETILKDTAKVKVYIEGAEAGQSIDFAQIVLKFPDNVKYTSIKWNENIHTMIPTGVFTKDASDINKNTGNNRVLPIYFALKMDKYPEVNDTNKLLTKDGKMEICTITFIKGEGVGDTFDLTALSFENSKAFLEKGSILAYFSNSDDLKNVNESSDVVLSQIPLSKETITPVTALVNIDYTKTAFTIRPSDIQDKFKLYITLKKDGEIFKQQIGKHTGYYSESKGKYYPIPFEGLSTGSYEVTVGGDGYITYKTTFNVTTTNKNLTVNDSQFYPGNAKPSEAGDTVDVADFNEIICAVKHSNKIYYPKSLYVDFNRDGVFNSEDMQIFSAYWK